MLNFVRKGAMMLLAATLVATSLVSCHDDDPDYNNVTPPTVEIAPSTVSGVITAKTGEFIMGATITLGNMTTTTDANGAFLFAEVAPGTYKISATAEGRIPAEGEVTVEDIKQTQNVVWSVVLPKEVKKEVVVDEKEESKAEVVTEAIPENDKAEIKVETVVPAQAVESEEEEVKIFVTPLYNEGDVEKTRAARANDNTMLVGASISCSDAKAKLKKAVKLQFKVDATLTGSAKALKYVNGAWVPADFTVEGDDVVIEATEFTAYGLFLNVTFSDKKVMETILTKSFDNLYGSKPMPTGNVSYDYKSGMEIKVGSNVLEALLVEKMAYFFGFKTVTMNTAYPLDVVLPVGTKLDLKVLQTKRIVSASANGVTVSGTNYGQVKVNVTTTNRQHSGGTN